MAWSDKARQAAAEARRQHGGARGGVPKGWSQKDWTAHKEYEKMVRAGQQFSQMGAKTVTRRTSLGRTVRRTKYNSY